MEKNNRYNDDFGNLDSGGYDDYHDDSKRIYGAYAHMGGMEDRRRKDASLHGNGTAGKGLYAFRVRCPSVSDGCQGAT